MDTIQIVVADNVARDLLVGIGALVVKITITIIVTCTIFLIGTGTILTIYMYCNSITP